MYMSTLHANEAFGYYPSNAAQVFKQSFWMSAWGSKTPKRTTLWSNSKAIRRFSASRKFARVKSAPSLMYRYRKNGQEKYQGNSKLKESQLLTSIWS